MFVISSLFVLETLSLVTAGIYWDKLSPEKLKQIKVLRDLKKQIEEETGEQLPTGPSETLPPVAERRTKNSPAGPVDPEKLLIWNIGDKVTWIDIRRQIEKRGGEVAGVTMFRQRGETDKQAARVILKKGTLSSDKVVESIRNFYFKGSVLKAKVMVKNPSRAAANGAATESASTATGDDTSSPAAGEVTESNEAEKEPSVREPPSEEVVQSAQQGSSPTAVATVASSESSEDV